jgi:hypothetical protein
VRRPAAPDGVIFALFTSWQRFGVTIVTAERRGRADNCTRASAKEGNMAITRPSAANSAAFHPEPASSGFDEARFDPAAGWEEHRLSELDWLGRLICVASAMATIVSGIALLTSA